MASKIDHRQDHIRLHATSLPLGAINTNIGRHVGKESVDRILSDEKYVKMLKSTEQRAVMTGRLGDMGVRLMVKPSTSSCGKTF